MFRASPSYTTLSYIKRHSNKLFRSASRRHSVLSRVRKQHGNVTIESILKRNLVTESMLRPSMLMSMEMLLSCTNNTLERTIHELVVTSEEDDDGG